MGRPSINISGMRKNHLTAIKKVGMKGHEQRWLFRCDCGYEFEGQKGKLGHQIACIKCQRAKSSQDHLKHGHCAKSINGETRHSKEYKAWRSIKDRCLNPKNSNYINYGARGIKMCKRWETSFENFLEDMGMAPKNTRAWSVGRIDNNKNYSKENCRWETPVEQQQNTRMNRKITLGGITKVFSDWCRQFNIAISTAHSRITRGWEMDDVFKKPINEACRSKFKTLLIIIGLSLSIFSNEIQANRRIIVPSADENQAGFFGSVAWQVTTNCQWVRSSTTIGNFAADADCDDNARVIAGTKNVTGYAAANSDGQVPQIKFSEMPAGCYTFVAKGMFDCSSGQCVFRFSDGTNNAVMNITQSGGTDVYSNFGVVAGEYCYTSKQGATTWQLQAGTQSSKSATINAVTRSMTGESSPLEISVYYFPPYDRQPRINYLFPSVEYSWENNFSAYVADGSATTAVSGENIDWINGNCTNATTGNYSCTFNTNFFSVAPNCTVSVVIPSTSAARQVSIKSLTSSAIDIKIHDYTGAAEDRDFILNCQRSAGDYRSRGSTAAIIAQPVMRVTEEYASGTARATLTEGAWTDSVLNTVDTNSDGGVGGSLASNQVTLPAGRYCVNAVKNFLCASSSGVQTVSVKTRLYNETSATVIAYGSQGYVPATTASWESQYSSIITDACFNLGSTQAISLEYYVTSSANYSCTNYVAMSLASINEQGAQLSITRQR